jgi:hypothetical protein
MKERNILGGIVAIGVAVAIGLGVVALVLSRVPGADLAAVSTTVAVVAAEPQAGPVVDVEAVYNPFKAGDPMPEGFRQLLARDQIEPVYNPVFTTADQVDWPSEMLVVAVASGGIAKAYPVTHLNQREMVIDFIAGSPILVSW